MKNLTAILLLATIITIPMVLSTSIFFVFEKVTDIQRKQEDIAHNKMLHEFVIEQDKRPEYGPRVPTSGSTAFGIGTKINF